MIIMYPDAVPRPPVVGYVISEGLVDSKVLLPRVIVIFGVEDSLASDNSEQATVRSGKNGHNGLQTHCR